MVTHFFKTLALTTFCLVGLALAAPLGPASQLSNPVAVNEAYISVVRNQELFLGAVGFGIALTANLRLKAGLWLALVAAFFAGTLFLTFSQAEDLALTSQFFVDLVSFHAHYLASGALVTAAFIVAARLTTDARRE